MYYQVTVCYVDYPMGASPTYTATSEGGHHYGKVLNKLSKEEAENWATKLNDSVTKEQANSGSCPCYAVDKDDVGWDE